MRETARQPHRIRWDEVHGRRVRTLEAAGPPTAKNLVVVVPGLGALGYLLDTLNGCAAWAHTFLVDVPGFGHRPPRPCRAEIGDMTRLLSAWLSTVPDHSVVLAGHSTGAQVALHAAVRSPDRVRALALLGPTFAPHLRTLPGVIWAYLRNWPHEPVSVLWTNRSYYLRAGAREMARYLNSARHDQPEQVIGQLTCPVLLVRGEHDALVPPDWLDRLATSAPRGRTLTVPGAHAFPCQHGGLTAKLIAEAAQDAG